MDPLSCKWMFLNNTSNLKVIKVVYARSNKQLLLSLQNIMLCADNVFLAFLLVRKK